MMLELLLDKKKSGNIDHGYLTSIFSRGASSNLKNIRELEDIEEIKRLEPN